MARDELQVADSSTRYEEVQYFHPVFHALTIGIGGMLAVSLVSDLAFGKPLGDKPAPPAMLAGMLVLFAVLYLLFFRLAVRVDGESVRVEFGYLGIVKFRWTADQILSCEPMAYRFRDFGGWGIRCGRGGVWAYTARGFEGVRLETQKRPAVIGTQRPQELAAAIRQLIGQ